MILLKLKRFLGVGTFSTLILLCVFLYYISGKLTINSFGGSECMKREREKAVIQFLLDKNDWVKADILAKQFSVSSRSIRKYVNEINEFTSPSVLIMSSNL